MQIRGSRSRISHLLPETPVARFRATANSCLQKAASRTRIDFSGSYRGLAVKLHQRGVDLLLNVESALDHLDALTAHEVRNLLIETEIVLRDLLARDRPVEPVGQKPPDSASG